MALSASSLAVPRHCVVPLEELVSPLWRWMIAARIEPTRERELVAACSKLWPSATRERLRAELISYIDSGREAELVAALHAHSLQKIDAIGPKLPAPRRAVLMAAATESATMLRATLTDVGRRVGEHPRGGPLLFAVARHAVATSPPVDAPSAISRQISARGAARGERHEQAATAWACAQWPSCKVLDGCYVVREDEATSLGAGVKGEFDALVILPLDREHASLEADAPPGCHTGAARSLDGCERNPTRGSPTAMADARLVAVVEAKAGGSIFNDVAKMLKVRDELMRPATSLVVRHGKRKEDALWRLHVGSDPPHVAYVFGSPGSFEEIVARSMRPVLSRALLEREIAAAASAGDAGLPITHCPAHEHGHLCATVMFSPSRVAAQQSRVNEFEEALLSLQSNQLTSFWGPPGG